MSKPDPTVEVNPQYDHRFFEDNLVRGELRFYDGEGVETGASSVSVDLVDEGSGDVVSSLDVSQAGRWFYQFDKQLDSLNGEYVLSIEADFIGETLLFERGIVVRTLLEEGAGFVVEEIGDEDTVRIRFVLLDSERDKVSDPSSFDPSLTVYREVDDSVVSSVSSFIRDGDVFLTDVDVSGISGDLVAEVEIVKDGVQRGVERLRFNVE